MEFKVGASYVVEIPGEGQVIALLCGRDVPSIAGEPAIPRWRVKYDGVEYIIVEQAILRPADGESDSGTGGDRP